MSILCQRYINIFVDIMSIICQLCHIIRQSCHIMTHYVLICHIMNYYDQLCLIMTYYALLCLIMSYYVNYVKYYVIVCQYSILYYHHFSICSVLLANSYLVASTIATRIGLSFGLQEPVL